MRLAQVRDLSESRRSRSARPATGIGPIRPHRVTAADIITTKSFFISMAGITMTASTRYSPENEGV